MGKTFLTRGKLDLLTISVDVGIILAVSFGRWEERLHVCYARDKIRLRDFTAEIEPQAVSIGDTQPARHQLISMMGNNTNSINGGTEIHRTSLGLL